MTRAAGKATTKAKRPPRARRDVAPGKPGPAPLVLSGYTWTPGVDDTTGAGTWRKGSPAYEVLAALAIGATWEHAGHYARLHEATPRSWNARGATALGEHATLDDLAATGPDPETLAYAAFHVAAAESRGAPVVGALQAIDRARKAGDWKAAAHLLKVLPQARPYTETTRQEVTGADGGPVEVDGLASSAQTILDLADRIAQERADDADA